MLNSIKSYQFLFMIFALLAFPCASKGESLSASHDFLISSSHENLMEQAARKKSSSKKSSKKFKLNDFAGKWVATITSIGGLSGELTNGSSFIAVGQIDIRSDGTGQFNYISGSTYNGVPGVFDTFIDGTGVVKFALTIIDAKNGAGSFTVVGGGVNDVVNFVATRSKATGKVTRIDGFRFHSATTVTNQDAYVLTRQNES